MEKRRERIKKAAKIAFVKSIPIMCSYLLVSMAYGIMMSEAGYGWGYSLFTSFTVYTGAFQFLLVSFLSSGAGIVTIAVTALLMNSRQMFYSLAMLHEFKGMGKRKLYMIHTMTDETFAVNITLKDEKEKHDIMFFVALFSRLYWFMGTVAGGVIGQLIPFDMSGIDFCMTALFITILIDQWEKSDNHIPAIAGIVVGLICLFLFQERAFMLPALMITSGLLIVMGAKEEKA